MLNLLILSGARAQSLVSDSVDNFALRKAESVFVTGIKQQSRIFNGPAHYAYGANVGGSAFFQDATVTIGTVVFEDITYQNVPLLYDLYLDKLVSVTEGDLFVMVSEKVDEFYLLGHHFVYKSKNDIQVGSELAPGFYDQIHDGKIKILVKRVKKLQFSTSKETPYYFNPKTSYFLERDGKYYPFSGESALLNLFKDKKNEVKKNLVSNKVKYSKDPEQAMVIMATYYESLIN